MMKQTSIAKITRPRITGVYQRKRLFEVLDQSLEKPVTWISGPAGSGKTTLVASWLDFRKLPCLWYQIDEGDGEPATFFYYLGLAGKKAAPRVRTALPLLTSEYLLDVPTFSRRYFENLCDRLRRIPFVLVFDNYQEISSASPFHDIFPAGLASVPEGVSVVIMSRGEPPPSYARELANDRMRVIGWEDLRLSPEESKQIIRTRTGTRLSADAVESIIEKTRGWAAGIVLMAERMKTGGAGGEETGDLTHEGIFNYFASELFERTDKQTQDFLLKTALLPKIAASDAEALTNTRQASEILDGLAKRFLFTVSRPGIVKTYEYHPLFREFLNARARQTYREEDLRGLRKHAALLLMNSGRIEDAAGLFIRSGDWEAVRSLTLAHARDFISEGRGLTVREWLTSLPENVRENDPWLIYWLAVCHMPFDLGAGRRYFEKAFTLFRRHRDVKGVFLAWSGAVEAIFHEAGRFSQVDHWITIFDELLNEYVSFPSKEIEAQVTPRIFLSLAVRQPDHPRFDHWKEKAFALLNTNADASLRMLTGFYLLTYHVWIGNYAKCSYVLDVIRPIAKAEEASPLARITEKLAEAWVYWLNGSYDLCLRTTSEAFEISRDTGVHVWDHMIPVLGVIASLSSGNLPQADQMLDKMASALVKVRLMDKFYYYFESSWRHLLKNDIALSLSSQETALALSREIGASIYEAQSRLAMSHLMHMRGESERAEEHLAECGRLGQRLKSSVIEFGFLLTKARFSYDRREEKEALDFLRSAMAVGREQRHMIFSWWRSSDLSFLCAKALEHGIEVEYVQEFIRRRGLVPDALLYSPETWPWPVKIYTLGRFELSLNDKPVRFSKKAPKKPLEVLKALIASGRREIGTNALAGALWPDADGDLANQSLGTTLKRLRQLIGHKDALQLHDGRISLEPRYCWVDAWAFEDILQNAEREVRSEESPLPPGERIEVRGKSISPAFCGAGREANPQSIIDRALDLYMGAFLPDDAEQPWTVSFRERLRNKFIRAVTLAGDHWLKKAEEDQDVRTQSESNRAVSCFEKGLEVDDLAEEFYLRLMSAYERMGRRAEAIAVYQRCKKTFSATLGISPSPQIEALYKNLLA